MEFKSLGDLLRPFLSPVKWGNWTYDANHFVLRHEPYDYEINLDQCTDSASVLDWIAQIAGKGWDAVDVGQLVFALDEIFHLQGTVCGGGEDRKMAPRKVAFKNGFDVGTSTKH